MRAIRCIFTRPANLGALLSSWLATLRFTSDNKAPTPTGPTMRGGERDA